MEATFIPAVHPLPNANNEKIINVTISGLSVIHKVGKKNDAPVALRSVAGPGLFQ